MSKRSQSYSFLFETTSVVTPSEICILENKEIPNGNKVTFEARLQTLNEVNQNKRLYSRLIGESIVDQLIPKATSRNLLMEIDHPMFVSSDPNTLKRRAGITEIVRHLIIS